MAFVTLADTASSHGGNASAPAYRLSMAGFVAVFMFTVLAFIARPGEGAALAVIGSPNAEAGALISSIASADGVLVRQSRYPWLAIAAPRAGQSAAEFRQALGQAGIHFTIHPSVLAGCFNDPV